MTWTLWKMNGQKLELNGETKEFKPDNGAYSDPDSPLLNRNPWNMEPAAQNSPVRSGEAAPGGERLLQRKSQGERLTHQTRHLRDE